MPLTREERSSWLSQATAAEVIDLADALLDDIPADDVAVVRRPEVGTVVVQVREPLDGTRFILADALACSAEVALGDQRGWALRLGDDRQAVIAQAICDAAAERDRQHADRIDALCEHTRERLANERADEWAALTPTIVEFEEVL